MFDETAAPEAKAPVPNAGKAEGAAFFNYTDQRQMPLTPKPRRRNSGQSLASTKTFNVSVEGSVPLDGVPARYISVLKEELKKQMRRTHREEVIKRLSRGENDEGYTEEYARRKTKIYRNVRNLGKGPSTFTTQGPVNYNRTGELLNSLQQSVTVEGDAVVSTIFAPPAQHSGGLSYRELVNVLDREKGLRRNALKEVKKGQAEIVTAPIKKAVAKTNQKLAGQSLRRANSFF